MQVSRINIQTTAEIIKDSGLKVTPARLAILNLFRTSSSPIGASSLHEALAALGIKLDLATLYRNLQSFIKLNLIRQVEFQEGKARFELSALPHHHHLICDSCGRVDDVSIEEEKIVREVANKSKFRVDRHSLEFFGVCASCQPR